MSAAPNTRPPSDDAAPERAAGPLPADAAGRLSLHDEVHARPPPRIVLPAWVSCVAVLHAGVDAAQQRAHLRQLDPRIGDAARPFERIALPDAAWLDVERHSEFTRYTLVQPLHEGAGAADAPDFTQAAPPLPGGADFTHAAPPLPGGAAWWAQIPGRVIAAVQIAMLSGAIDDASAALARAQRLLGPGDLIASRLGNATPAPGPATATESTAESAAGHSIAVTDFRVGADGFERIVVISPPSTTATRAGRIAQRLLDIEVYRMMALRGLPVSKALSPVLSQAQAEVAAVTAALASRETPEKALLDRIVHVAARLAHASAEHGFGFAATKAYDTLVAERIGELREKPIPGLQTIGEFMRRRLSPATATVAATWLRLERLTEQIAQASDLIRTRVDIAAEAQSQQLLQRLAEGQALQLRMQMTVEGLSIAAISYYAVGLLGYGFKALKAAGLKIDTDLATGLAVPIVVAAVWWLTRRIHHRLQAPA